MVLYLFEIIVKVSKGAEIRYNNHKINIRENHKGHETENPFL